MEDDTPETQEKQQVPSIWDKVDALTPRPVTSIWDRVDAVSEDPRRAGQNFIMQEGATRDPAKAADVIRLSRRYKLPEPFVEKGYDRLIAEEKKGSLASEDLLNSNPALADLIAQSPNYSAAALKHLPALKQVEMLYTRPQILWPKSDAAITEEARTIAKLRAERDWKSEQGTYASGVPVDKTYPSLEAMQAAYTQEELEKRKNIEAIIGGSGPLGTGEAFTAKHPNAPWLENVVSGLPFLRVGPQAAEAVQLAEATQAVASGTADDIQKDLFLQNQRLAAIQKLRGGQDFRAHLATQGASLLPAIVEMGAGMGAGRVVTGGLGLKGAAAYLAEPAIGAVTGGAPDVAQEFIKERGEGATNLEAGAKSLRDSFANYMGAKVFGPWFSKAAPEAQVSIIKAMPVEALKLVGMGAASDAIKSIGPDAIQHFKDATIIRAMNGDADAWRELLATGAVGAALGGAHAFKSNSALESARRDAEAYAKGTLDRSALAEPLSKESPELAETLRNELSKAGPNQYTYIPVQSFTDHFGDQARMKAAELLGDPAKYDHAKAAGADMAVPIAAYDRVIGADPGASKFFANEIRPEPGTMNLREAQATEEAYNRGIRIPARERIVQQIVEEAKGDKAKEAVGKASLEYSGEDLLKDPAILGLSDDQVSRISKVMAEGRIAAEDAVNAKEQARRDAMKSDLYKAELERTKAEVAKEVDARPEQVALARLQKKRLPNGTPLAEDQPTIKLSKVATEEMLKGSDIKLPPGVTDTAFPAGKGYHPEDVATMLGYNSAHDLFMALDKTSEENRKQAIANETDFRMGQKFPNGLSPAELSDEAIKALHNEQSAKLKQLTLQYIVENKLSAMKEIAGSVIRKPRPTAEITRDARADINAQSIGELNPKQYLAAEHEAAREALKHVFSGNWEKAFDAKLQELEAHERFRAAMEAIETTGKIYSELRELPTADYLNKPGVYDWGQQVKILLRKIGLAAASPEELEGAKPFNEWAKEKFQGGATRLEPIGIDPRFADDKFQTTFKDMKYQDVLSFKDTIDQLTHLAKDIDQVQIGARKAHIASIEREFEENVQASHKKRPPELLPGVKQTLSEKAGEIARKVDASLVGPEAMFDELDNGNLHGPMNELFQAQVEARTKYQDMKRRFAEGLRETIAKMPKDIAAHLDDRIKLEGVNTPLTRRAIIGMVLNGGNESNYSKMVRGEEIRGLGLTVDKIQEAAKLLSEAEKDFVQKILDITNQFRGEIVDLHKWATGKAPVLIKAKQMIEAMGDRPGGYYPAMYDESTPRGKELKVRSELGKLLDSSWRPATTDGGYREKRVEAYAAPMDYDLGRIVGHIDSMAKDIAYRKWLTEYANKLGASARIEKTMSDYLGPEYKNFLPDWIKRVVGAGGNSSDAGTSVWRKAMATLRHNITIAQLAMKPGVFLHHALGIGPAIDYVGSKWFMKGYGDFLSKPKETYKNIIAESPEMAHYLDSFDANIRQSLDKLGSKTGVWADMQRLGMKIIPWGNMLRAIPTYIGAKAKAIAEYSAKGMTGDQLEKTAIRSAEKAVRLTSGSGHEGDLPAIMKSDGMKMLLMFYTPGRVLYSQLRGAGKEYAKTGNMSGLLASGFWLLPAAAVLHTLVSGRLPNEDKDETWAGNIAKDVASYPFSALPMGHEIARNAIDAVTGSEHDLSVSTPLFKALDHTFKSIQKTEKWFQDEAEFEDVARELMKTAGFWMGAPTEQLEISGGYLLDLARHRGEDPNDIFEFAHDVLWRRPPNRRP